MDHGSDTVVKGGIVIKLGKLQRKKKMAKIDVRRSKTVHDLLFYITHELCY